MNAHAIRLDHGLAEVEPVDLSFEVNRHWFTEGQVLVELCLLRWRC